MLALKLLLLPSLICAITLAARRWGPELAGWLSGFPIVAGPLLLLIALEQGAQFAAVTAAGALVAVTANVAFSLSYSWLATRLPWWLCLLGGYLAFGVVGYLLTLADLPSLGALLLSFVAILASTRAFPFFAPSAGARPPRIELLARMVAGAMLVLIVTYCAPYLGPRLSGLFSAPPLLASVLVAFAHPTSGAGFAVHLLQGMVFGFFALATFCFVLAASLPTIGIAPAFLLGLACSFVIATALRWMRARFRIL